MSGIEELIANARVSVSDADRCVALGITPASYGLHRHLREVLDALAAAQADLASRDAVIAEVAQMIGGWRSKFGEDSRIHEVMGSQVIDVQKVADVLLPILDQSPVEPTA